jgi:AcrR family transcriptional regulator
MIDKAVPTKPRLTSEERKTSIVQAAMRLFAEKGFRGTTTRELAAAVGVSEPILYEHFKTKRDLYTAIIETAARSGEEIIEALRAKYAGSDDDRGFFTDLAAVIVQWHTKGEVFIRLLLFSNLENHELKDLFFEKKSTRVIDLVAGYIARRVEAGGLRAVDPQIAARAFLGMIANYALYDKVFRSSPCCMPEQEVADEMVGIFLGGLCRKEE